MYIPPRNSHSLGDGVRIEDGSSMPIALPFVGVPGRGVGMLLEGKIHAESCNTLKSHLNLYAQVK